MEYIEPLIPSFIKELPTHMDFDGQRRAEKLFQIIILLFGVVGFIWGYVCQQFSQTMYILFAGFILSCILTLPPWPMYRRKPLVWQPARPPTESSDSTTSAPQAAKSGKKKKQ